MKTRHIVIVGLFVAIAIPQAALAAWWNPFSWKIFDRLFTPKVEVVQTNTRPVTDTTSVATTTEQNEEVEQLKQELEALRKQSAQKDDTSTVKSAPSKPVQSSTEVKGAENFNGALSSALSNGLLPFTTLRSYIASVSSAVDNRMVILDRLISRTETKMESPSSLVYEMSNGTTISQRELDQVLLDAYKDDRAHAQAVKNQLTVYKNKYDSLISEVTAYNTRILGRTVNRDELVKELTALSTLNNTGNQDFAKVKEIYTNFKESSDDSDSTYRFAWDKISSVLTEYKQQSDYVPPTVYVPPVRSAPRFTSCFVSSYSGGGTIQCSSL